MYVNQLATGKTSFGWLHEYFLPYCWVDVDRMYIKEHFEGESFTRGPGSAPAIGALSYKTMLDLSLMTLASTKTQPLQWRMS